MPPVFGPLSPSKTRLWSQLAIIGTIVLPSVNVSTDTSSPGVNSLPVRYSSTTTWSPAAPNALSSMMRRSPSFASCSVSQMSTPLPSASPSAFRTTGNLPFSMYASAAS